LAGLLPVWSGFFPIIIYNNISLTAYLIFTVLLFIIVCVLELICILEDHQ